MSVEERPADCRCTQLGDATLVGTEAVSYCDTHLRNSGLHWDDGSHDRAGYSCRWTARYWILTERSATPRLIPVSYDKWQAAASEADNDFGYAVDDVFDISGRGRAVAGHVEWGSVRDGQTLDVLDESGALVTRVTASVGFDGGLLLTGPGRHLVRGGHRLRHMIGDG